MNPTKAESKSRRSSILKPPKSRQPLQNVELNASSAENSPATSTTKVKRRVSFAEKKHVKEFCDSMEQGTVWDNTYEESELSQRNSQNSNNDENTVTAELTNQSTKHQTQINVVSKTISETVVRESIVTVVESRSSTLVYKETTKLSEERNSRAVVSEGPTRIPFPTNHVESFKARRSLAVCEAFAGKEETTEKKPKVRARADSCSAKIDSASLKVERQSLPNFKPPTVTAEFADCNDVVPMDETIIADASVELALPISTTGSAVKDCALRNSSIAMAPNTIAVNKSTVSSINPVPDHLILPETNFVVNDNKFVEKVPNMKLDSTEPEKFAVFHDTSMDMTEAISHLPIINNPEEFTITASKEEALMVPTERTMLQMQNMEITEPVSNIVSQRKSCLNEFDLKESVLPPRKSILQDQSMDFTEVVPGTLQPRKSILQDKSMDFTEVVPGTLQPRKSILQDKSMDFTEVVPGTLQARKSILQDKSMDFTEVVPGTLQPRKSILQDRSMDFTEVVPRSERPEQPTPDKTTIFHNKSVDFTEIIRNMPNMDEPPKLPSERTTIFHDRSVDFTNAVESIPVMKQPQKSPQERTTIFHDKSVDFTEVVSNVPCVEKLRDSLPEGTTIFHNESMDFTEVASNVPDAEKLEEPAPERTTIFHNKSVDFTEIVPNVPSVQKPQEPPPERTAIFHNESLDFTEAVSAFQTVRKSLIGEEEPVRGTILRHGSADLIGKVASTEKPQSKKSQKEDRNILQNFHASDLAEAMARISRATETLAKGSSRPIEAKIATDAEPFIPMPQKPSSEDAEPAIHSPLPKRLKPLGNETINVTAALPFIAVRRAKKQGRTASCDDESLETLNVSPRLSTAESIAGIQRKLEEVNRLVKEKTTTFESQSMEETEVAPRSFPLSVPEEIAVFQNRLTRTLDPLSGTSRCEPALEDFPGSNDDDDLQQLQNTTVIQDESMDITCSIPCMIRAGKNEVEENSPTTNFQDQSMEMTVAISRPPPTGKFDPPDYGETKTTVFCDDSMQLTEAVQYSSNDNKQIFRNYEEHGKGRPNNQPPFMDKENCPLGMENLRPPRVQTFEEKSRLAGTKNEWLDLTKSVPFLSSQKNKENRVAQEDFDDQSRFNHMGSDEITGVVPFASQNDEEHADDEDIENYRKNSRSMIFENQEMELDVYSSAEKNPYRSSQVAKGLFQQRIPSAEFSGEKNKSVDTNERRGTADLQAEVRQLVEDFALENESGFDQATFLRQQAQCMEDYEANSTASQDCNSATQSTRTIGALNTISEYQEPAKSNDTKNTENEQTLPIADWETPRDKTLDASVENGDLSAVESHCVSSKSLEELRYRAYSVSKYQPDLISNSDNFHETIMLEDLQAVEPPSFTLEDSVLTKDRPEIVESALSLTHGLPTDSEIRGNNIDGEVYEEGDKTISQMVENVSQIEIPEITMTQTVNLLKAEERMERKKMNHSQTYVLKKSSSNPTIFSSSSTESGQETAENGRRSSTGATTAADFSSESPNGPCEKLRRTESVLPIEGIEELPTKFANAGRSWGRKSFANSTVIGDDATQKLMHRDVEEASVVLECSVPNEFPSAVETNEERNVSQSVLVDEVANDTTMKAEVSVHKSPFEISKESIEELAGRLETIWKVNRLDKKVLAFNFFSDSIVLAIFLNEDEATSTYPIKIVRFLSQLVEEGTDPGVSLAHSLIMKKVDSASLTRSYRTYEDIPQLLDFVTTEVKMGMDFMFELDHLRNQNVMEIVGNRVTFMIRTSDINAGVILNVTMEVKPFEEITCNDITISYILGSEKVRESDIKNLIKNIKRDHRFLRYYMSDVKDYVDLMAETGFSTINATACN